jgi:subtilisin family serine protease
VGGASRASYGVDFVEDRPGAAEDCDGHGEEPGEVFCFRSSFLSKACQSRHSKIRVALSYSGVPHPQHFQKSAPLSTSGSHVASTAIGRTVGVAKGASVVAVRVLDCQGTGSISDTVAGLDW